MNGRYSRQLPLPGIGAAGQHLLGQSRLLVVGAGGIGCPALTYLAAAGVGQIDIAEPDIVEISDLNRQFLYKAGDVGKQKALCAQRTLTDLNDEIKVSGFACSFDESNADRLLAGCDAALLCTDNLETRLTLNRACLRLGIPFADGGITGFQASMITVLPGKTPCLECIYRGYDSRPPAIGVLGCAAGILGSMQALAVLRLLLGTQDPSFGRLICLNMETMHLETLSIKRRADCPSCSSLTI
jgi:molybdopterin/thiamine biosynthesis adenylyltransferase